MANHLDTGNFIKDDILEIIARCPLFSGIAFKDLATLLACVNAYVVSLDKGKTLFLAGEKADKFGVLLSGSLSVAVYDRDGRRSIIKHVAPTEIVAAAQSISRHSFAVSVEAESPSKILVMKSAKILSPCDKACAFHLRLMRNLTVILACKTLDLNDKIGILSRRTISGRLLAYLECMADECESNEFDIPFNRQALADYLCVDRCALSSEIGKLVKNGTIAADKTRFTLLK